MNETSYIGMRYVPVFADPSQWDISRQYESLMMVTDNGETYISKQFVPTGIELTNEDYWVKISVPSDDSSGGGINYSTEEQDTGLKWIDGKTIYQKSYIFTDGDFHQDFIFTDSSLINCSVIKGWNYFKDDDGEYSYTDTAIQYISWSDTGKVKMAWGPQVAFSMSNTKRGYITLQYVKLSETPSE